MMPDRRSVSRDQDQDQGRSIPGRGTGYQVPEPIRPARSDSEYEFISLQPDRIPGAEEMPRMEFVPRGMETPVYPEPTKKDLEPLREVSVTPMDYLRTPEERSFFLSRVRYRIGVLPFSNTNIFILQVAAIIALYITIAVNFYISAPETSILEDAEGFTDFLLWDSAFGASVIAILFGSVIGGFGAYAKGLSMQTKTLWSMRLMQAIAVTIGFITVFFIFVPFFEIDWLDFNNLEIFMNYVIIPSVYLALLLMFSAAVIFGVYGLLTSSTGPISLSTALIFMQIFLGVNSFRIESDNLYSLFLDESRIALFSMAYLAYVELSFAVSKFSIDWKRTRKYDHRTGERTFTFLLGHTINLYILFFIGIIIATYLMAMFSTNLDWVFARFITPAMEDSISHSTIYGKILFTLLFFGTIGFVKGIIPVKEYIEGRMNISGEDVEIPMTIVDESEQQTGLYNGFYRR